MNQPSWCHPPFERFELVDIIASVMVPVTRNRHSKQQLDSSREVPFTSNLSLLCVFLWLNLSVLRKKGKLVLKANISNSIFGAAKCSWFLGIQLRSSSPESTSEQENHLQWKSCDTKMEKQIPCWNGTQTQTLYLIANLLLLCLMRLCVETFGF